ncbi:MAG: hypothetical protein M3Z09_09000 [Acidobacteriota bacterium]|nr:hypothetical protein [Acidobacteriota bacterium]
MSFLDNLENNLKAMEGRDESGPENQRQRELDRNAALKAAPWAEKLKSGSFTQELLKQTARVGHELRTKVFIAWIGASLKLEARDRKLELCPTPNGVEAVYREPGGGERREPVDLEGSAEQFVRSWLAA